MRLNQIQIIGRIGQDAKIHDHQGRKFLAFSVGVDEGYKDAQGVKVERVMWCDCTSDQERFFKVATWLTKGREVFVEGRPSVRTYEKDGRTYASIKIQVANISLGSSPNDERPTATAATARPSYQSQSTAPVAAQFNPVAESDDLPF